MKFVVMMSPSGMYYPGEKPVEIHDTRQDCVDAVKELRAEHKGLFFWTEALNDSQHPGPLAYYDYDDGGWS